MLHAYQIGAIEPFSEQVMMRLRIDRSDISNLHLKYIPAYRKIAAGRMCIVLDGKALTINAPVNRGSVILDSAGDEWRVIEDAPRQSAIENASIFICPVERIYSIHSHAPTMAATA